VTREAQLLLAEIVPAMLGMARIHEDGWSDQCFLRKKQGKKGTVSDWKKIMPFVHSMSHIVGQMPHDRPSKGAIE
jgi:hypothetical protein